MKGALEAIEVQAAISKDPISFYETKNKQMPQEVSNKYHPNGISQRVFRADSSSSKVKPVKLRRTVASQNETSSDMRLALNKIK